MSSQAKKVFYADYVFYVWREVYEPAEDSFLFAENLTVHSGEYVLDMGTGCGILGIIASEKASRVVAVDINPFAVRCAKENAKLNGVSDKMFFIQGDLFTPLKAEEKFDLILFNAPYLPSEPSEVGTWIDLAWSGGADGRAVIDRFLRNFPEHLKANGRVLLEQSTITNVDKTLQVLEDYGFKAKVIAKRDFPLFETIVLIEAKR
ncbi:MAG: class I SAM-dependent methyltransferase [Candidatus Bathyarchaeota archaeon]|nr:class I SAM-dependent methyltransferase [Candidatus Bathyarchaeota archaeon]MDW8039932.1 class I SAM-dependent methyltransferase [Nitrososphaerota archaeon]